MVLGLKPMGKLITWDNYLSVRRNQGLTWFLEYKAIRKSALGASWPPGGGGGKAQVPPSCLWWIRLDGSSYHRARSSFPRTVSPSIPVFLIPTRSSPPSTSTVVSSKPSSWTHSLQIHCNGSAWPRFYLSMGPSPAWKTWTLQYILKKIYILYTKLTYFDHLIKILNTFTWEL